LGAADARSGSFSADRAASMRRGRTVTYKDALKQVRSAPRWILAQGPERERPLVILSDNSVEHALFALAAQHVGVPSAAISPAYSLMSKDFDKLRSMVTLLQPGAIYVSGTKAVRGGAGGDKAVASGQDRERPCGGCRRDFISHHRSHAGNA
jgi:feruloyl-CoA synthase